MALRGGSVGRSGWTCTVTSARSRSARTARCARRVGCRARRRGWGCWRESLLATDRVALEVTGSCVGGRADPRAARDQVIVVSPDDTGITQARAKTDRLDARTLARLLWTGELEAVWMPR